MSKNKKQKAIQRSIYFEPDVLQRLEHDMMTSDRKISGEINHNLKKLFAIRDKNNQAAIDMSTAGQDSQPQK